MTGRRAPGPARSHLAVRGELGDVGPQPDVELRDLLHDQPVQGAASPSGPPSARPARGSARSSESWRSARPPRRAPRAASRSASPGASSRSPACRRGAGSSPPGSGPRDPPRGSRRAAPSAARPPIAARCTLSPGASLPPTKYFGVQSRCRCLASASTSFRNFRGRFWKTRQSVLTVERRSAGTDSPGRPPRDRWSSWSRRRPWSEPRDR